jgi:hypothetical protein
MPKYGMNTDLKSILCHSNIFSTLNRPSFKKLNKHMYLTLSKLLFLTLLLSSAQAGTRVFLPQITGGYCDADNLELTQAFYKDRDQMFHTSLAKAVEDSNNCLSLKNRQQKALQSFFAAYGDYDGGSTGG